LKIKYLCPEGVLEVEQAALRELERKLPGDWFGYAGFQLFQRGQSQTYDIDLLLFTRNRAFLVELKNWRGDIEFDDRQWVHKGIHHKSPVGLSEVKARVLKNCLQDKFGSDKLPFIEHLVLLCNPNSRMVNLPDVERRFALSLAEFLSICESEKKYLNKYSDSVQGFKTRNPISEKSRYDSYFSPTNPQLRARTSVFQGFRQNSLEPDYQHPRKIWSEFRADYVDLPQNKGLLRKWNFAELAGGSATSAERANVALREMRVNETVRFQLPELHSDLLEPIGLATPDDVTTNFIEGYRLPKGAERLAERLVRSPVLSHEDRVSLSKSILVRFAKLHNLGIAHRDITARTLWVIDPSRIILSSFAAARVPEAKSVGVDRVELETGAIRLPEDLIDELKSIREPFLRDVFLLGALVYEVIESKKIEEESGVPLFDSQSVLTSASLMTWFERCLDWDPYKRFKDASEALEAFNLATTELISIDVDALDFEQYQTAVGPLTVPPVRVISQDPGKSSYEANMQGTRVLVKCWPSLQYDSKNPSRNRTLLKFLEIARSLKQSTFEFAPEILEFGFGPFGLTLVTKWIDGVEFEDWIRDNPSSKQRAQLSLSLVNIVTRLHAHGCVHGDLKHDNILVQLRDGEPHALLLDLLDLSANGSWPTSTSILPEHLEAAPAALRDLHTSARLVAELLEGTEFETQLNEARNAIELVDVPPPLDLLSDSLQRAITPLVEEDLVFVIKSPRFKRFEYEKKLEGDNGKFPVGVQVHDSHFLFFVTGVRESLVIKYELLTKRVMDVSVREISHETYVSNARRSKFRVACSITLANDRDFLAHELVDYLISNVDIAPEDADVESVVTSDGVSGVDPYLQTKDLGNQDVSVDVLWRALADSDELNAPRITIRNEVSFHPDQEYSVLVTYDLEEGVIDFGEDEKIDLAERGVDSIRDVESWFRVGYVSSDIGKDIMRIRPLKSSFRPKAGASYYLRGSREASASDRRVSAMRRVLGGRGLISNLAGFFEPKCELSPIHHSGAWTAESLGRRYGLNESQSQAMEQVLGTAPMSLLQGPPGTGKTKFIASFVHHVLTGGHAKNILLVSQSHEAVNNALSKSRELLLEDGRSNLSIVRVGSPSMVPPSLMTVHEDSLRQSYRERFDAEVKQRVAAVGSSMGLPSSYIDSVLEIYLTLGTLLRSIAILEDRVEDEQSMPTVIGEAKKLRDRFAAVAENKFGFFVEDSQGDIRRDYEQFLDAVAEKFDVSSRDIRKRFEDIFWMSSEFSSVLRSPHSNFTSFLSKTAQIVAGTCVGIGRHSLGIVDHAYDWVIVDEAARASPMELVVAMQAGRRVLLVGDHFQLPPLYPSAVESRLCQMLNIRLDEFRAINNFHRAFASPYGREAGKTLMVQYRMAENISRLVSKSFYSGELSVGRKPPGVEYHHLPTYATKEVVWIDTSDTGRSGFHNPIRGRPGSLTNEIEANVIVALLKDLTSRSKFFEAIASMNESEIPIGVITMYSEQRDLIRRKLDQAEWAVSLRHLFTVGTVDSYQGKENRIIIVSVVRNDTSSGIGFLKDSERINVALSRAKDRLFIVSSTQMWSGRVSSPINKVLTELMVMVQEDCACIYPSKKIMS
jgi:serine/threonine protein kinase